MSSMRVATLNIWNRGGPWEERLAAIRHGLRELAADIVGLQEVIVTPDGDRLDQAAAIADGLGYHFAYGASFVEGYSFGNAVLSRWPIVRHEVTPLPRLESTERRSLLSSVIAAPFGEVPFFVTHLNWKFDEGHIREAQVLAIADVVKAQAPGEGFPAILVGDMNAEPEADEVRFLRGLSSLGRGKSIYFADCFAAVGEGKGATFSRKNPYAAILREPDRRIDYVFVRGPDDRGRGEPLEARVCFDAPHEGTFPSDHFGVVATVSV